MNNKRNFVSRAQRHWYNINSIYLLKYKNICYQCLFKYLNIDYFIKPYTVGHKGP